MLSVDATLVAESTRMRLRFDGHGNVVTCRLDGDAAGLLETIRRSRQFLAAVRAVVPVLLRTGLRLEVLAGSIRLARLGTGVRQNALGRLLRLPNAHIGA